MAYAAMLGPFVTAFERQGGDIDKVLTIVGLNRRSLAQELLPAQPCYDLMEEMARALDDPYFCYSIGAETRFAKLPNLKVLNTDLASLGELLTALVVDAKRLTNLANYSLTTKADIVVFAQHRTFKPLRPPGQPDGFLAGIILRVIRETIGEYWNPSRLKIRVSSARVIPRLNFPSGVIVSNARADVRIDFPAEWLLIRQGGSYLQKGTLKTAKFPNLVDGVRELLRVRLSEANVRTEEIASHFLISKRVLQSNLSKAGTSVRKELTALRKVEASRLLRETDMSIAEVGKAVGHPIPSSFSRVFRVWYGVSPRVFVLAQRNSSP